MNRISALIKETRESSFVPPMMKAQSKKTATYEPGNWPSKGIKCWRLNHGLPSLKNNKK